MDNYGIKIDTDQMLNLLEELKDTTQKIEKNFNNMDQLIKNIENENETWNGKSSDHFQNKYYSISNKFPSILSKLKIYNLFLKNTIDSYNNLEKQVNKTINENAQNLTLIGE